MLILRVHLCVRRFYNLMEDASEQGVGVLLYTFQDFVWPCFAVVAFWMRKHLWTVDHAVAVIRSRCPSTLNPKPSTLNPKP